MANKLLKNLKFDAKAAIQDDARAKQEQVKQKQLAKKYQVLFDENEDLRAKVEFFENTVRGELKKIQPVVFTNKRKRSGNCYNFCATDWHVEKGIRLEQTNGRNEYNPRIAKQRIERFWQSSVAMAKLYESFSPMERILLWLGGDGINGGLHYEDVRNNTMGTTAAVDFFVDRVLEGLDYINSQFPGVPVDILGNMGNHPRTTHKPRSTGEAETSWEMMAYLVIARQVTKSWPKMRMQFEDAYEAYYQYGDHLYRFQHGTFIKSAGGIGGSGVPVRRRVMTTSKSAPKEYGNQYVSRDTLGHFHQYIDERDFGMVNCLCGPDGYTLAQIGSNTRPSQAIQVFNQRRGKVLMNEILLED